MRHVFNDKGDMLIIVDTALVFTFHLGNGVLVDIAKQLETTTPEVRTYILNYLGIKALVIKGGE